jgi:polyhydroxyalkanoate depolymerase
MIYQAYQAHVDATEPFRALSRAASSLLSLPWPVLDETLSVRNLAAAYDLMARSSLSHRRRPFHIDRVTIGNREVAVAEEDVAVTPFCTLLHFKKDIDAPQPRVLVVAPMSGHFATLLRGTVMTMLPDHDVYITDWHNARDVPLRQGIFDLDAFIAHIIEFLERLGPPAHVLAICQPSVPALAAAAVMAEADNPAQPRSMILMAGPIDTRINPTKVNEFATGRSLAWFERNLIGIVPMRFAGALRRVYPGFMQLAGFMGLNVHRHVKSAIDQFTNLVRGDRDKVETVRSFYEEYFAVMDLSAEFYLQTIRTIFHEHALPRGCLEFRGSRIDPAAIKRTWLLTVEGDRDDICAIGQTLAAQDLCSSIRPYMKRHYVQTGVGHYGVFNGRKWANEIYPIVRDTIHVAEASARTPTPVPVRKMVTTSS